MYSPPIRSAGRSITRLLPCWTASILATVILTMLAPPAKAVAQRAIVLEIDDAIGPAIADYVVRELRTVSRSDAGLIVLRAYEISRGYHGARSKPRGSPKDRSPDRR